MKIEFLPQASKVSSSEPTSTRLSGASGFPSPANDYLEKSLDLHELLIKNSPATYFLRVAGNSMENSNIFSGDILVVDRSAKPVDGRLIVATLNGKFVVRHLKIKGENFYLYSEKCLDTAMKSETAFEVWGVVTYIIHEAN